MYVCMYGGMLGPVRVPVRARGRVPFPLAGWHTGRHARSISGLYVSLGVLCRESLLICCCSAPIGLVEMECTFHFIICFRSRHESVPLCWRIIGAAHITACIITALIILESQFCFRLPIFTFSYLMPFCASLPQPQLLHPVRPYAQGQISRLRLDTSFHINP
jgi:hypothetical protein